MSQRYVISDREHAEWIIDKYENHCSNCGECSLRDGGWRCTYVYMQAVRYMQRLQREQKKKEEKEFLNV